MHMKVGEMLRKGREAKGLTLRDLQALTGIPYATISRLENDQIRPAFRHVVTIARALGLKLDRLVDCE